MTTELFIGSSIRDLHHAKRWMLEPGVGESLRHLLDWADSKRSDWGRGALFFEIACKRYPGERGQIDLLIAFPDRLAVVEVKDKPLELLDVRDAAQQVDQQATLIQARLTHRGISAPRKPAVLLFLPKLTATELREFNRKLNDEAFSHVRAAGCLAPNSAGGHDIVTSVERWLSRPHVDKRAGSLVDRILQSVITGTIEPARSIDWLLSYVGSVRLVSQARLQPVWHVERLRAAERQEAVAMLGRSRFLEVHGPQGAGKTALVKDLLAIDLKSFPREVSLQHCYTPLHVARMCLSTIDSYNAPRLGEHELVTLLNNVPEVIWISRCDAFSRVSLERFLSNLIAQGRNQAEGGSRWLIESTEKLRVPDLPGIALCKLSAEDISVILERVPGGASDVSPSEIAARADGNPTVAIGLYRAEHLGGAPPSEIRFAERNAPWFILVDLALENLGASVVLFGAEFGTQATVMAFEAARKILESLIVAQDAPTRHLGYEYSRLRSLLDEATFGEAINDETNYLRSYRNEAVDMLDKWLGRAGSLAGYPGGAVEIPEDAWKEHPSGAYNRQLVRKAIDYAASLTNWGLHWYRVHHEDFHLHQGWEICYKCERSNRPIYMCVLCLNWVCETCSLLRWNPSGEYENRVCEPCNEGFNAGEVGWLKLRQVTEKAES